MNAFKTTVVAASLLLMSGFAARAEVCAVMRNGVLVHVYCAVVAPVVEAGVDIIGTIIAIPERILFGRDYADDETVVYDRQTTRRKYYGPTPPLK
jgi:hypothetical protein